MIWTCEVWSDLIGLASAGCMSVPAWQSDSLAGFAAKVRQALAPPAAGRDPNAANVLTELKRLAEEWKPQDRFWLRMGLVLLGASFVLKMVHHGGWQC